MKTFLAWGLVPCVVFIVLLLVRAVTPPAASTPHRPPSVEAQAPAVPRSYVTKGGYMACTTEEALTQTTSAAIEQDTRALGVLIATGRCFMPRAGLPLTLLKVRWTGRQQVRLAGDTLSAPFWTSAENVVERPAVVKATSSPAPQQMPARKKTRKEAP